MIGTINPTQLSALEGIVEFGDEAAEAAVGEDGDHVARFQAGEQIFHDGFAIREEVGFFASGLDVLGDFGGIEPGEGVELILAGDLGDVDAVGGGKGLGQFFLKNTPAGVFGFRNLS